MLPATAAPDHKRTSELETEVWTVEQLQSHLTGTQVILSMESSAICAVIGSIFLALNNHLRLARHLIAVRIFR